jgi:hypothetical protein
VIGDASRRCEQPLETRRVDREGAAGRPVSQETSLRPPSRHALAKGVALLSNRKLFTLCGALVIIAVAFTGIAGAASSGSPATVTVRVEGLTKTLLAPTKVTTHTGSITKGGTPAGVCPATTAAGALDVATHHNWTGSYDSKYEDLELIGILGESHPFTSKDYWDVFVGNVAAAGGICDLTLHQGEQLLFAAVPDSGTEYPIGVQVAAKAVAGKSLMAKIVYYDAKGKATPLKGATVEAGKHSYHSNTKGEVTLKPSSAGTLVVSATEKGYIRSAPATVHVKK